MPQVVRLNGMKFTFDDDASMDEIDAEIADYFKQQEQVGKYEKASSAPPEAVYRGRGEEPPKYQPGRYYEGLKRQAQTFENAEPSFLEAPFRDTSMTGPQGEEIPNPYFGRGETQGRAANVSDYRAASFAAPNEQIAAFAESMNLPPEAFRMVDGQLAYEEGGKLYLVSPKGPIQTLKQAAGQLTGREGVKAAASIAGSAFGPAGTIAGPMLAEYWLQEYGGDQRAAIERARDVATTGITYSASGLDPFARQAFRPGSIKGYDDGLPVGGNAVREFQESQGITPTFDTLTDNPTALKAGEVLVPNNIRAANQVAIESGAAKIKQAFDTGVSDKWKAVQGQAIEALKQAQAQADDLYRPIKQQFDTLGPLLPRSMSLLRDLSDESKSKLSPRMRQIINSGFKQEVRSGSYAGPRGYLFSDLLTLKSDFGDIGYAAKKGLEGYTTKDQAVFKSLAASLRNDLADIVNNYDPMVSKRTGRSGFEGVATKWREAESYHKNAVVPLKNSRTLNSLRSIETPEDAISKIAPANKVASRRRAQIISDGQTPEGRRNIASALLDYLDESSRTAKGELDPDKFFNNARNWKSSLEVFVGDNKSVNAFINLMGQLEAQSRYLARKNEGMRLPQGGSWGAALMTGAAIASTAKAALTLGAAFAGLRKLLNTKRGQNLIVRFAGSNDIEKLKLVPVLKQEIDRTAPAAFVATQPERVIPGGSGAFQEGVPDYFATERGYAPASRSRDLVPSPQQEPRRDEPDIYEGEVLPFKAITGSTVKDRTRPLALPRGYDNYINPGEAFQGGGFGAKPVTGRRQGVEPDVTTDNQISGAGIKGSLKDVQIDQLNQGKAIGKVFYSGDASSGEFARLYPSQSKSKPFRVADSVAGSLTIKDFATYKAAVDYLKKHGLIMVYGGDRKAVASAFAKARK